MNFFNSMLFLYKSNLKYILILALIYSVMYTTIFQILVSYRTIHFLIVLKYVYSYIFIASLVFVVYHDSFNIKDTLKCGYLYGAKIMLAFPFSLFFVLLKFYKITPLGFLFTPFFLYVLFLLPLKRITFQHAFTVSKELLTDNISKKLTPIIIFSTVSYILHQGITFIIYDTIFQIEQHSLGHIIANILGYTSYFFFISGPVLLAFEFFKREKDELKNNDLPDEDNFILM